MLKITEKVSGGLFLSGHGYNRQRKAPDLSDSAGKKQTQFHKMTQSGNSKGKGQLWWQARPGFPQRPKAQGRLG